MMRRIFNIPSASSLIAVVCSVSLVFSSVEPALATAALVTPARQAATARISIKSLTLSESLFLGSEIERLGLTNTYHPLSHELLFTGISVKKFKKLTDNQKKGFIQDRQLQLQSELGPQARSDLDTMPDLLSAIKITHPGEVEPDHPALLTIVSHLRYLCNQRGAFMFDGDLQRARQIYHDLHNAIDDGNGNGIAIHTAIVRAGGAPKLQTTSHIGRGTLSIRAHTNHTDTNHHYVPLDLMFWRWMARSPIGRASANTIQSLLNYRLFCILIDIPGTLKDNHNLSVVLASTLGLGLSGVIMTAGAAITATAAIWNPVFGIVAGVYGLVAVWMAAKQWYASDSRVLATKSWKRTLIWAGSGLALFGAAAAPAFTILLGAHALHIVSIGLIIALALGYDAINGAHDTGLVVAPLVGSKTLTRSTAVILTALCSFLAYYLMGLAVAKTVGKGLIVPSIVNNSLIIAALVGGGLWNWFTLKKGIPVSSSHSLIGGLVGAALAVAGFGALQSAKLIQTVEYMVASPLLGLIAAYLFTLVLRKIFSQRDITHGGIRSVLGAVQIVSAASLSVVHAANDGQKTMGIILALLIANGLLPVTAALPLWVVLSAYSALSIGTWIGGRKVVRTMSKEITLIDPITGTAAALASAVVIGGATENGIPVSTTHAASTSIAGGGIASKQPVEWRNLYKIVWAWVLTIPCSALVGAATYYLLKLLLPH